ncbi:MAG: hypothetical protein RLZZ09_2919, partial [Pseudomonadota bacterium]
MFRIARPCLWHPGVSRFREASLFVRAVLLSASVMLAPAQANVAPPASAPEPANDTGARFDVWEYQIDGNTTLDNRIIEKTVYGFLGENKGLNDVEQARSALEKAYHEAGYQAALVTIPEQDVQEGVVVLRVTEGTVDQLKVTGSRYFSPSHIKEQVPALAEGTPLNTVKAQEQLTKLAGENPDRQVTP